MKEFHSQCESCVLSMDAQRDNIERFLVDLMSHYFWEVEL